MKTPSNPQASQNSAHPSFCMVGLGKMGGNMVRRLLKAGISCSVFDLNTAAVAALEQLGARGLKSLNDIAAVPGPRAVWVMVPAGDPTEKVVMQLAGILSAGDTIIDGGNSFYKDDVRRAAAIASKGIHYLDAGTSGGVWGEQRGYCLMVGGDTGAFKQLEPVFKALAPGMGTIDRTPGFDGMKHSTAEQGYLHCGPVGAGHFVKMIHNGIEYGMMQAFAEGFDIMRNATKLEKGLGVKYDFPLTEIAELWRRGSVVSSWLLDLTAQALVEDPNLSEFTGVVEDSGEGRWTVNTAIETAVPAEVLTAALYTRFRSRQEHTFAEKVLSAMRKKFGGHVEKK